MHGLLLLTSLLTAHYLPFTRELNDCKGSSVKERQAKAPVVAMQGFEQPAKRIKRTNRRVGSLECAGQSALWPQAGCHRPLLVERAGGRATAGQSGDRSPHSKELNQYVSCPDSVS